MNRVLAIIGAGHLGQQIAHFAITDGHYESVVFFDDFCKEENVNGFKVLGTSNHIETEFEKRTFNELVVGIGYKHLSTRKLLFDKFEKSIPFATIIHSSSWIDSTAKILSGTVVYPMNCIDANVVVDHNSIINLACTLSHDVKIGRHCFLAPSVSIAGFSSIGDNCFIGINTTVIDNVVVGESIQTGGASLLLKNITEPGSYVGNPAKKIK